MTHSPNSIFRRIIAPVTHHASRTFTGLPPTTHQRESGEAGERGSEGGGGTGALGRTPLEMEVGGTNKQSVWSEPIREPLSVARACEWKSELHQERNHLFYQLHTAGREIYERNSSPCAIYSVVFRPLYRDEVAGAQPIKKQQGLTFGLCTLLFSITIP